jgi:hypothetical protein
MRTADRWHRSVGLLLWLTIVAGCGPNVDTLPCMTVGAPGPLVTNAAIFRLDVYGAQARCAGPTVADGAGPPIDSHIFERNESIVLDAPPGGHTLVLTTFADAQAAIPLGEGCLVMTLSPGAQDCFNLTLQPISHFTPPTVGDMTTAWDMARCQFRPGYGCW